MIIHDIMLSLIQQLFRGFNFFRWLISTPWRKYFVQLIFHLEPYHRCTLRFLFGDCRSFYFYSSESWIFLSVKGYCSYMINGSYTSFYGALFIYIGALFSLVERIIYLLLKDYYTFKTMAEVSLVFFPAFRHPRPGKHYNTYFFSLLFPPRLFPLFPTHFPHSLLWRINLWLL